MSRRKIRSLRDLHVAIISDVHAYEGSNKDTAPSHCCISENDPTKNALSGLRSFVETERLSADVLLCPGDLGDKAHPGSVQHVWRELHGLQKLLKAKDLFVATGNHDVDSRHAYNDYDARGMLQRLDPSYPFGNTGLNDKYWARHFVIITRQNYRIVVLNSSAFHGEGRFDQTKKYEYEQGRVTDHTINGIRAELEASENSPQVNILLCHHHPHPHSELRLGDGDLMMNGKALLDLLGSGKYGRWIIIHGHKHHPKLEYAAGVASSPIIFAAGSIAAHLYGELQTASRNQFYILTFPLTRFAEFGLVGHFRAWDWLSGSGWKPAPMSMQLPASGGFGFRGDPQALATKVAAKIKKTEVKWIELLRIVPELNFLMPQDGYNLVSILAKKLKTPVAPVDTFPPNIVGKKK